MPEVTDQLSDIRKALLHTNKRLDTLTEIAATQARFEERVLRILEKQEAHDTRLTAMEKEIYGKDGILVRLSRVIAQGVLAALVGVFVINLFFQYIKI